MYQKVVSLGRRNATVPDGYSINQTAEEDSGRLEQHVVDFETLSSETVGEQFKDKDVFFCTLGTTRRAAGSAAASDMWIMTMLLTVQKLQKKQIFLMCRTCHLRVLHHPVCLLYLKTKGEVEDSLKDLHFPKTSIFRPGFLDRGSKKRFVEKMAGWVLSSISVATVAKGLLTDAENYVRSKNNDGNQEEKPTDVTYANADILALLSTS
ncbi:Oxidoreductase htatip2 [Desmophyllum pertusum]|uniref:Oxidoreductase htatip2 n=1 Tax=Desmophyllum pertusum TaxID=174260 RepID=A0A9W9ZQL3_9CNID|nr:Oxidoreductase htatip2 [Desmophyllum pertusum]